MYPRAKHHSRFRNWDLVHICLYKKSCFKSFFFAFLFKQTWLMSGGLGVFRCVGGLILCLTLKPVLRFPLPCAQSPPPSGGLIRSTPPLPSRHPHEEPHRVLSKVLTTGAEELSLVPPTLPFSSHFHMFQMFSNRPFKFMCYPNYFI